ncbi:DEAD/DEAH box helicase [Marinobacter halodurans]|nr:DEAD/DEAH box helicase [Marinobacter halodurans]
MDDMAVLEELEEELLHRSTQRAEKLLEKVRGALNAEAPVLENIADNPRVLEDASKSDGVERHPEAKTRNVSEDIDWDVALDPYVTRDPEAAQEQPEIPISDQPANILDAWTVLEALSPQSYKRPNDLVMGDGSVAWLKSEQEPWLKGEKSRPKKNLYYVVYLGAIDIESAMQKLLMVFQDDRVERPAAKGFAAVGAVLLDKKGIPIPDTGLSISSFGWAYARALQGKVGELKAWALAEKVLLEGLERIIYRTDSQGRQVPFSLKVAQRAFQWIIKNCGIPEEDTQEPSFAVRRYQPFSKGEPDTPLLNSFFLDDLQLAKLLVDNKNASRALSQYLGLESPPNRHDLISDAKCLEDALEPQYTPLARWPGKGRYPLVLLQQAAINLCHRELGEGGLFSVNGPPGTGKTTLLRDVVASVQVDRAKALSKFDDVGKAFQHAGKMKLGSAYVHLYELHPSLKGHELLVASSNNKAVENVSRELPLRSQIAEDIGDLEYFKVVSDALASGNSDTWGLVAAVLGNSGNRSEFINKAWWDKDSGLRQYFLALSGQDVSTMDEDGEEVWPQVVTESSPPASEQEARQRWQKARDEFHKALAASEEARQQAQKAYECYLASQELRHELEQVMAKQDERNEGIIKIESEIHALESRLVEVKEKLESARAAEETSLANKPGIFVRLLSRAKWNTWKIGHNKLVQRGHEFTAVADEMKREVSDLEHKRSSYRRDLQELARKESLFRDQIASALRQLEQYSDVCGGKLVTDQFWSLEYDEQQRFAPNFTSEAHKLRDDVFVAAIKLQKAFIDSAAKPLRQNLGVFFYLLGGGSLRRELQHLLPDIWSTGFLLTPVISTTFASVGRMLKGLPKECIGWLLIDEAGQATPQAAVGAISRARRVISVGDPLQIEPVVTLPPQLVDSVSRHFGVDSYKWMAPHASVQTLSDESNPYGTKLQRDLSELWIGAPLLVHRRCENPMFSISNRMAYNKLMVHATKPSESYLTSIFGQSAWIDVVGNAQEKWCPEEGERVCQMLLEACDSSEGNPDLFVITPFRRVAEKMRQRMSREVERLEGFGMTNVEDWIRDSIGTVHTFQGKEAKGVILLLGAPGPSQTGARNWATSSVNLLNVAVSRAKQNFYVVGNRKLWADLGNMKVVSQRL